jgi:hypothetical protein
MFIKFELYGKSHELFVLNFDLWDTNNAISNVHKDVVAII